MCFPISFQDMTPILPYQPLCGWLISGGRSAICKGFCGAHPTSNIQLQHPICFVESVNGCGWIAAGGVRLFRHSPLPGANGEKAGVIGSLPSRAAAATQPCTGLPSTAPPELKFDDEDLFYRPHPILNEMLLLDRRWRGCSNGWQIAVGWVRGVRKLDSFVSTKALPNFLQTDFG